MEEVIVKMPHLERLESRVDAIGNVLSRLMGKIFADIKLATPTGTTRDQRTHRSQSPTTDAHATAA